MREKVLNQFKDASCKIEMSKNELV